MAASINKRTVKRFTKDEDDVVLESIKMFGVENGIYFSARRLNRSERSVKERYLLLCDKCRVFTPEEISSIISHRDSGKKFREIAKMFGVATPSTLRILYNHVKNRQEQLHLIINDNNQSLREKHMVATCGASTVEDISKISFESDIDFDFDVFIDDEQQS